jgi:MoaA/NifB/PqqE/SkfB family radical SAM enzyme
MKSYRETTGNTIISTHISPEGSCNLNCDYCSVKRRTKHYRIELDVIVDYIEKLHSRGLKAVIITGGGEPTLYPQINELIEFLISKDLSIALITNGTLFDRIENLDVFSWIRVSLNSEVEIHIPKLTNPVVGFSLIYENETVEYFREIAKIAKSYNGKYIRVLPNCLHFDDKLLEKHREIEEILKEVDDPIFFHQFKIHRQPNVDVCHQSYFRPYLSEVDGGTIYPCDSFVLNEDADERFHQTYQICRADQILDFLDGKIKMNFEPQEKCKGCVFTGTVEMLGLWKKGGDRRECLRDLIHENFV